MSNDRVVASIPYPDNLSASFLEKMPDAVLWADHKGDLIYANQAACDLIGQPREQILQWSIGRLDQDFASNWEDHWKQLTSSGSMILEIIHRNRFGDDRHLEIHGTHLQSGDHEYVCGIIHDVTERKKIEKELERSRERFTKAFRNSPNVIILTTFPEGKIIDTNETLYKLSGYHVEEVMGMTTSELDFWMDIGERNVYIAQLRQQGQVVNFEARFRRKEGKIITALISGEIIELEGEPCIISVIQDISERKAIENALKVSASNYQVLFHDSPDAYLINQDGIFVECNKAAEKMLRGSREQILGKDTIELSPEFQPEGFSSSDVIKRIRAEIPIKGKNTFEWVHRRLDGTDFYVEVSVTSIEYNGKPAIFNAWRDISDRKNAELILKQSEKELKELNATKDRFFSIIAHDLKSPFNSIVGFSNLLTEQVREKDYDGIEAYADIIQRSSNRALNLLKNLLDWARIQTGRLEYNPEYVEMVQEIQEVVMLLNDLAIQKSISLRFNLPHKAPAYADKAMIQTVLRNLISNALKFTNPGGEVIIALQQHPSSMEVSVSDNGLGMSQANIDKLFRIEESFSTSDTNNEKGTGLGLILCHEFIRQHKGEIHVESTLGKGSKFSFSIPKR